MNDNIVRIDPVALQLDYGLVVPDACPVSEKPKSKPKIQLKDVQTDETQGFRVGLSDGRVIGRRADPKPTPPTKAQLLVKKLQADTTLKFLRMTASKFGMQEHGEFLVMNDNNGMEEIDPEVMAALLGAVDEMRVAFINDDRYEPLINESSWKFLKEVGRTTDHSFRDTFISLSRTIYKNSDFLAPKTSLHNRNPDLIKGKQFALFSLLNLHSWNSSSRKFTLDSQQEYQW